MKINRIFIPLIISIILFGCTKNETKNISNENKYFDYIGRYYLKQDLVITITASNNLLKLTPSFFRTSKTLDSIGIDKFASILHPNMKFEFIRDTLGKVKSLKAEGHKKIFGDANKLKPNEFRPVELLLSGNIPEAIKELQNQKEEVSEERIVRLASKQIQYFPSKAKFGIEFAKGFESKFPNSINLQHIIGIGYLIINNRVNAQRAFEKAYLLDPKNNMSKSVIRLLKSPMANAPPKDSWQLPFDVNALFELPTKEEIDNVMKDWKSRNFDPKDVEIVDDKELILSEYNYNVRVVKHSINGIKHYGAVLIPKVIKSKKSPVLLELHGVDPWYTPFNIDETDTPHILKENIEKFIILIPSFRGNSLIIGDTTYTSGGSPTNAWDGATDDAISFLNAALKVIPEADPNQIHAFGKSRGGTVALLLGIRDSRIKSVIDWTGPTDWFSNMGTMGFTLKELIQWGLWDKWNPGDGFGSASQKIEQCLKQSIEFGTPSLSEVRLKLIASSPLYFLEKLPSTQFQYGIEDASVPISNAYEIQKRINFSKDNSNSKYQIHIYDSGHDLPYPEAYNNARIFLLKNFD